MLYQRPWGPSDSTWALQWSRSGGRWPRASSLPLSRRHAVGIIYPRPRAAQALECSEGGVSQHGQIL
eukprot:2659941-Pyramimonas_sp.AAC.1